MDNTAQSSNTQSNYQLMNVRELIDRAFGDLDGNTVNFRLIQTVLYLIARQLKILERHVEVSLPKTVAETASSFKVTEVKIHATKAKPEDKEITAKSTQKGPKRKSEDDLKAKKADNASVTSVSEPKSKKIGTGRSAELHYLEEYVNMREKELRVIHQRADSHEQPDEAPKPMASMEDTHYEKLLVVERVPEGQKRKPEDPEAKISIVTQREFQELSRTVEQLSRKFEPIGTPQFPENQQLMEDLRKNASLTDAMAALQLSARLEATEKVLGRMVAIVTDVVSAAGQASDFQEGGGQANVTVGKQQKKKAEPKKKEILDRVTMTELEIAIDKVAKNVKKKVSDISEEAIKIANNAFKLATSVETRLASSEDVGPRMEALEHLVALYAEQINILDTFLSSQVTNYQEQLTQMQHELEVGLEAMNEALANAQGGDTVAVTELNDNFISLQIDLETMTYRQKTLHEIQENLANDLKAMWKQIEMLRETKSDRDEVADALRDKAGIKDLNGIVSIEQFDAVRGDLEKQIGASYDKFNNQEIVWQKAIDDVLRELKEKADVIEVTSLQDSIAKFVNDLKRRMNVIANIVGQPRAAAVDKKIFRDSPCICCSSPAVMDAEEPSMPPALPKAVCKKKEGSDISKPKGDGDHNICYPGLPIPHPPDPRSRYCHRYCGGSHTLVSSVPQATAQPIIRPDAKKPVTAEKVEKERVPCLPCQETAKPLKKPDEAPKPADVEPIVVEAPLEDKIQKNSKPEEASQVAQLPQSCVIHRNTETQRKTETEKSVTIVG